MFNLYPYQHEAISRLSAAFETDRRVVGVAPTGCHAPGSMILMHDGTIRRVEDIAVGDALMGPDSTARVVQRLIRGRGAMVAVTPNKGEPFVVNEDHILTLVRTNDGTGHTGGWVDISVADYLRRSQTFKHIHKLVRVGVCFPWRNLPLDPYFLGILLGDGAITHGVAVGKGDKEIHDECLLQAALHGLEVRTDGNGSSITHHIHGQKGRANPITKKLRDLGLFGADSDSKFIPHNYLTAARPQRMELLAGLMDTDGHTHAGGYDYISKSPRLADGVAYLARSVGLAVYVSPCIKSCQTGASGTYYRVGISGDCSEVPCRIPRKQARRRTHDKDVLRTGFSIAPEGNGDFYGFTLCGDGRYLMGDFTVTHNSGKTIVAAEIMRRACDKRRRVLFLVHRHELLQQTAEKLRASGVAYGLIKAGMPEDRSQAVQLASVQTLVRRELPPADLVVCDEAHRGDYAKVTLRYPSAKILGLTATPVRLGGKGMADEYDRIVTLARPQELVASGYIVPSRIWAPSTPDLRHAKVIGGDYSEADLAKVMGQEKLVGDIVSQWRDIASTSRTIVFAVNITHAAQLLRELRAQNISSDIITSDTCNTERDILVAKFRRGSLQVLVNVGIFVEGLDVPNVECVVMARPTKSLSLFMQMAGRGCRRVEGKDHYKLLDHTGNSILHGPPDMDREFTLEHSRAKAKQAPLIKIRQCRVCYHIWPVTSIATTCPACGWANPPRLVKYEQGHLVEVDPNAVEVAVKREKEKMSDRERERRRLWAIARQRGEHRPFQFVESGLRKWQTDRDKGTGPGGIPLPPAKDIW